MNDRRSPPPRSFGKVLSIESHSNPRIKAIRALNQGKRRRESGEFIAEGLKLVTDALEGGWTVRAFVHKSDALNNAAVAETAARARASGADIISVTGEILAKVTRRENPQTVIGIVEQQTLPIRSIKPDGGVWIVLEEVRDPGNLGTIIRTADGVGASGVILVGSTVDPFSLEAVRATMGSIFKVPLVRVREDEFLQFRQTWPGAVIGTHLSGNIDYRNADYREPLLLVMGNEQAGLTAPLAEGCDQLVRIPMAGSADSLNLAVATGVMLYESRRKHLTLAPLKP